MSGDTGQAKPILRLKKEECLGVSPDAKTAKGPTDGALRAA
jgi:hypothetical protein